MVAANVPLFEPYTKRLLSRAAWDRLVLVETLDWAAGVLNRVDRGEFFKSFEDEHAVQYF